MAKPSKSAGGISKVDVSKGWDSVMKKVTKVLRDKEGRVVEDAVFPLNFTITAAHVRKALCKDPANCVIAQAVRAQYGFQFEMILVGASIIKVYMKGKVIRFATPKNLREALRRFDRTKLWDLPAGTYTIHPPTKTARLGGRPNRWKKHRKGTNGSGRQGFSGHELPSRWVEGLRHRKSA